MKKINCKHGLNPKEEISARRMKRVIDGSSTDKEQELIIKIKEIYDFFTVNNPKHTKNLVQLYNFIEEYDKVVYSAFERVEGYISFAKYVFKNNLI